MITTFKDGEKCTENPLNYKPKCWLLGLCEQAIHEGGEMRERENRIRIFFYFFNKKEIIKSEK